MYNDFVEIRLLLLLVIVISINNVVSHRVIVPGATGYIGRQVVKELVSRGLQVVSLVRVDNLPDRTYSFLQGSEIVVCNVSNPVDVSRVYSHYKPTRTICCLASRSGVKKDSWLIDYQASLNTFRAQEAVSFEDNINHFVLLSAFCCGKPLLQFQFAKLKLEEEIKASKSVTHSIVRPTAFFKSLDGQIEGITKGYPSLYFGDGTCAANPISETDLASFLVDSAVKPESIHMLNQQRDVGGPDVPPISKADQINIIYDVLKIPKEKRWSISFRIFTSLEIGSEAVGALALQQKFEDAAEIAKIVKYYATEPMVAIKAGEVQGSMRLRDHFQRIANRGGMLEEVDKMTTTTGVLELFAKNEYSK